jgi:hypothetical protein
MREIRELSKNQVARSLAGGTKKNPQENYLRRIERGDELPSVKRLIQLARLYKYPEFALLLWGGYAEELLRRILGLINAGFQARRASASGEHEPDLWFTDDIPRATLHGTVVAFRAFPLDGVIELPTDLHSAEPTDDSILRFPTRRPRRIALALDALRDEALAVVDRRLIAARYVHAWVRSVEPSVYAYVQTFQERNNHDSQAPIRSLPSTN